jgi:hypothetical protein
VKAMINLLRKTSPNGRLDNPAFLQGLLEWRNTPRKDGISPAEIVFGHLLRSIIPAHHSSFAKKWREEMRQREVIAEGVRTRATVKGATNMPIHCNLFPLAPEFEFKILFHLTILNERLVYLAHHFKYRFPPLMYVIC